MGRSIDRRPPTGLVLGSTFDHGDARDVSSLGGSISFFGGASIDGTSLDLSGVKDYATVASNDAYSFYDGTNDKSGTISLWINADNWLGAAGFNFIAARRNVSTYEYQLYTSGNGGVLKWLIRNYTGTGYLIREYTTTMSTGSWVHVACSYDGGGIHEGLGLYLNGTSVGTSRSLTYTHALKSAIPLTLGYWGSTANADDFDGHMDSFRFYDRQLSSTEIATIYEEGRR